MPEHRSPAASRWAHRLRRALTGALWLVALWWFGGWLWDQPFMGRPVISMTLTCGCFKSSAPAAGATPASTA